VVGAVTEDIVRKHALLTDNNAGAKPTKIPGINGYTKPKQHALGVSKKAIDLEPVHM
jgi:hypothetical protein